MFARSIPHRLKRRATAKALDAKNHLRQSQAKEHAKTTDK